MKNLLLLAFCIIIMSNIYAQSILIRPNKLEANYTNYENFFLKSTATPNVIGIRFNGSLANPSATSDDNILISLEGRGYAGGDFTGVQSALRFIATQNWNANNRGTRAEIFTTQNNSTLALSRVYINQNGKVGIGNYLITVPDHQLEIQQPETDDKGVGVYRYGGDAPSFFGIGAKGSIIIPTATLNQNILARFGGKGHTGVGFTSARARIDMVANENWTETANGADIQFYSTWAGNNITEQKMVIKGSGNVGIGFETPESKLSVNGDLQLAVENKNFADGAVFNTLGRGGKSIVRFNGNGTAHIKGIAGGVDGQVLHFVTTNQAELKLYFRDGNAAPEDRIEFSQDGGWIIDLKLRIRAMGGCTLIYDGIDNFWRVLGNN